MLAAGLRTARARAIRSARAPCQISFSSGKMLRISLRTADMSRFFPFRCGVGSVSPSRTESSLACHARKTIRLGCATGGLGLRWG